MFSGMEPLHIINFYHVHAIVPPIPHPIIPNIQECQIPAVNSPNQKQPTTHRRPKSHIHTQQSQPRYPHLGLSALKLRRPGATRRARSFGRQYDTLVPHHQRTRGRQTDHRSMHQHALTPRHHRRPLDRESSRVGRNDLTTDGEDVRRRDDGLGERLRAGADDGVFRAVCQSDRGPEDGDDAARREGLGRDDEIRGGVRGVG